MRHARERYQVDLAHELQRLKRALSSEQEFVRGATTQCAPNGRCSRLVTAC
jgi:hypothetical protein